MKRRCVQCHKTYNTDNPDDKFCSTLCELERKTNNDIKLKNKQLHAKDKFWDSIKKVNEN